MGYSDYGYFYPSARSAPKDAEGKRLLKNRLAREARAAAKASKIRMAFWGRCQDVINGILALEPVPDVYLVEIPKLFAGAGKNANERYEVFRELDEKPGGFSSGAKYWVWHGKLRAVRNHPVHGRELFAVINSKGA